MVLRGWLFLAVLQFLPGATHTKIKLNNGGFEDIVIAINPALHEDNKIVDNIKDMIKEASTYLFNATRQRFYFKAVKIVIPLTWTPKPEYKRVSTESYGRADVIVADPFLKYNDEPYTLQYGGCGEPGRYIHFTPNFLTNDSLQDVYGSRGRVFVHEWAHLRWGVFDEYNNNAPFYTTGINTAEATRCSADITGQYIVRIKSGTTRKCRIEHRTQLYETGCQFIPDKKQTTPASIMYMQSLSSVSHFCDESNHNIRAPNMQNKMCNFRSTWDVIKDSPDFASSSPRSAPPPDPAISLLQTRERVLCLVFDISGNMNEYNRISRLRQAAGLFLLQLIEMGSWVGIVTFSDEATIQIGLQQIISDSVRQSLTAYLPTTAGGGTSICSGIRAGYEVFLQKYSSSEGCEIVLLAAGEDSALNSCFREVGNSGSIIHTIALGPNAPKELEMLADVSGGLKFSATDSLDSNGLLDAFIGISSEGESSSESGTISQQLIQLESKGQSISPNKWLDGTVSIDRTVGSDTSFIVTWNLTVYPPGIFLTDPKGKKYVQNDFTIDSTNLRTAQLKIPGTAEAGDWSYSIVNTHSAAQAISINVFTRAASPTVPPVTVKSYMNRDTNTYPSPVIIYAEVSQGFLPVVDAKVTATVESALEIPGELELFDDGSGADIMKNDGIYSRYFTSFNENGRYSIKICVQGKDKKVRWVRRQSQIQSFVENGIRMNAPRSEATEDEIQANLGHFNRIATGNYFTVVGVPSGRSNRLDVLPPCKITDLEVELDNNTFILSWSAPGNDYDVGKATRYEIKMSENPLDLRNATFHYAHSLNTSGLTPEVAGVKQFFQYEPENITKQYGTSIYFAIRAIDDSNNVGEVSNIARAVVVIYPLASTPSTNDENNTVTIIVITICVSAIIICAIVNITVCVLHKQKSIHRRSPETAM